MVMIYEEPELLLIRLEIIGQLETFGVVTKRCEIVMIGDLPECLAYMVSAGQDISEYLKLVREGKLCGRIAISNG